MRTTVFILLTPAILAPGSITSQQVVFPLHIGDRWEYSQILSGVLADVLVSRDTVMPNAQRYFVFEPTPPESMWPYDFRYLRQAGNKVYHYNTASQSEEILYRFDAAPGDTLLKVPIEGDTVAIIFHNQETSALFGIQRRHWYFGLHPMHLVDVGETRRITDSLGLTDVTVANGGSALLGALVDGIIYGDFTSAPEAPLLPVRMTLHQNYPNPFNPSTTIRYGLPHKSTVQLTVFNTLGQQVAVLEQGEKEAGYHEVKFDGTGLSSGVYFYRLQAGDFVQTRKLLLLR
jgi:hypothetical protein